jgi:FkbM family methyltransferase
MHGVRAVVLPPARVYRHLHFVGPFKLKNAAGKSLRMYHHGTYVENALFWTGLYGDFEGQSLFWWEKLCQKANVIFDIGANTGIYALVAKLNHPHARVFAFEPVPAVYEKLKQNVRANGFDIACDPRAVSSFTGAATIYLHNTEHVYSVTVNQNLNSPDVRAVPMEISTVTLDQFVVQQSLERVDLLKIDVETHEPEVLAGMTQILRRHKPDMIIEILLDDVGRRVEQALDGLGYWYFHVDEKKGPYRDERLRGHSPSFNYIVCQPNTARAVGLV